MKTTPLATLTHFEGGPYNVHFPLTARVMRKDQRAHVPSTNRFNRRWPGIGIICVSQLAMISVLKM